MATLVPRDVDFIDTAPIRIVTEVTVAGTPDEVFAVISDNERWPEWFPAAKECRTTSEIAEGVGATRWIHFDLFKVNERFVAWDRPNRWAFTVTDANLPGIAATVEQALIEPVEDGTTKVTYTVAADLRPYLRPLAPLIRRRFAGLFARGLDNLSGQVARVRAEG